MEIIYPSVNQIVAYNVLVLNLIAVKKADKANVLNMTKIYAIIDECETIEGDLYDKAVVLLKGIVQKHPFASGNRRTAFIVAKDFLLSNSVKFKIKDDPAYARVMVGIREGYYTTAEIKEWVKDGKIREFKR